MYGPSDLAVTFHFQCPTPDAGNFHLSQNMSREALRASNTVSQHIVHPRHIRHRDTGKSDARSRVSRSGNSVRYGLDFYFEIVSGVS